MGRGLQIQIGATVAQLRKDMLAVEAEVLGTARDAEKAWKKTTDTIFGEMERKARETREQMNRGLGLRGSTSSLPFAPGGSAAVPSPAGLAGATAALPTPKVDRREAAALIQQAAAIDQLRASMDPLYAATLRYETVVEQVSAALEAQAIDQARANQVLKLAEAQYEATTAELRRMDAATAAAGGMFGRLGARAKDVRPAVQNLSYQVQDFAVQVAAGTSAAQAMGQQFPQMLGGFGVWGAAAGAAAAVLLPIAAVILTTGEKAETAEDRIDRLRQTISAYVDAAEAARTPTAELAESYSRMAGAARDALRSEAERARNNALRELAADADALAASLEIVEGLAPQTLTALAGAARSGQANAITAYDAAIEDLAAKFEISAEAAAAFYASMQRAMAAEGPDAIVAAAEAAREELIAAAGGADNLNEAASAAVGELNAMVLAGGELDGAMNPVVQKAEEFSLFLRDAHGWAQRVAEEMRAAAIDARLEYQNSRRAGVFVEGQDTSRAARQGDYLGLAQTMLGSREDADRAAIMAYFARGGVNLDPVAEAWCAAFVNATLEQAGFSGTNSNMARSFLQWGREVQGAPQVGDIGVLPRGDDERFGHVGIVSAVNPNGTVTLLGGNQGDAVSEQTYSADRFLGFRRPDAFGEEAAAEARRSAEEAEREAEQERAREAREAADEAKRLLDVREDLVAQSRQMTADAEFEATLIGRTAEEQARLRAEYILTNQAKAQGIDLNERIAGSEETYAEMIARTAAAVGAATVEQERLNAAVARTAETKQQLEGLAQSISGALGNAFVDAMTGAESFGAAMRGAIAGVLADLARLIVQQTIYNALARSMGLEQGPDMVSALGSLFGGARAAGGPVRPGKTYLVGEKGPELFSPGVGGTIVPNHQLVRPPGATGSASLGGLIGGRAATAPQVTLTPAPVENVVLLGDADAERLVSRPGVQRNLIRLMEREGFRRG